MSENDGLAADIRSAEIVLPGKPFDETLAFFIDELGFRCDMIYPADAPRVAVLSGYGIRLCLDSDFAADAGCLRLTRRTPGQETDTRTAPNGTTIKIAGASLKLPQLQPALVVTSAAGDQDFGTGRAGMQYRDLIPGRYGGRFIASHIRIEDGGPVADDVHYHDVLFQLIFCVRGWVSVVYEDQGPPILLQCGDCFLQPPHIRHRVLESSDNMEVVEIACPAEHETRIDHELRLPTKSIEPDRDFAGQRFVCHHSADKGWEPWTANGYLQQDTGIARATGGIVSACEIRAEDGGNVQLDHDGELRFLFVIDGTALLECDTERYELQSSASCAIPGGLACALTAVSGDFRMLEVFVPSR